MPCGPLQTLQIYALTTGSARAGALALFCFAIGTVPAMLGAGIIFNWLANHTRYRLHQLAMGLMILLSLSLIWRGIVKVGVASQIATVSQSLSSVTDDDYTGYLPATIGTDRQELNFDLSFNGYQDLLLQVGLPAQINIHVDPVQLSGCNQTVIMPDFGIEKPLQPGENLIEIFPHQTGTFIYSCWMQMLTNKIKVIDDQTFFAKRSHD